MAARIYEWGKVKAGDIISFRYKSKKDSTAHQHTVVVLNPRLPNVRRDGVKNFHMVGLKLQQAGSTPLISDGGTLIKLLQGIGGIQVVSGVDDIYKVKVDTEDSYGAAPVIYEQISGLIEEYSVYRTYDYKTCRKSGVLLEPLKLPDKIKNAWEMKRKFQNPVKSKPKIGKTKPVKTYASQKEFAQSILKDFGLDDKGKK